MESEIKAASSAAYYLDPAITPCLWDHRAVEAVVSFKKSKRCELINLGKFPKPLRIDGKTVWDSRVICRWVKEQIEAAKGAKDD